MRTFDPPFDRTFWASMPKVEPYLFIAKNDNSSANLTVQYPTTKIVEYSLGNTEAYIIVQHNAAIETWLALSTYSHTRRWGIFHGCHYAHGDTNYDQDAAWFSPSYFLNGKWELIDNRNIKLYGSHLPILGNQFSPPSTAADAPFSTIMSNLLTNTITKKITLNYESNQEWHTWDFEKAGTFTISDLRNLNQILARKYLVNIFTRSFDGSSTQLLLKNRYLTAPSTSFDYFGTATFNKPEEPDYLSLSYIDETDTLTVVDAYSKKHFLGFIPSTADVTELTQSAFTLPPYFSITNCFDPRLENGDLIKIDYPSNMPGNSTSASSVIEVIETYNEKGLRTEIKGVPFPDGVTKQGSYKLSNQSTSIKTRIETDQFNGVLSTSDNNVQAALDTLDDHDHSGLYQPLDTELTALAGLTSAANKVPRFSGSGTAALINVEFGTWTPTGTTGTNVASMTVELCHYIRVGDEVYFHGAVQIDTTAIGAFTCYLSLPIASNFSANDDANGNGTQPGTGVPNIISIREDQTNDRLQLDGYAQVNTNLFYRLSGGYIIK